MNHHNQTMATDNNNITSASKNERTVVSWMIHDPKVSISKNDISNNPELSKALSRELLRTATIDRQGLIHVPIAKTPGENPEIENVPFVNVQAQIGVGGNRKTYAHVNIIAGEKVGYQRIRDALNQSMETAESRWIVKMADGSFDIQASRPA
ncbi:hypothetical protein UCREL1_7852 [Eutypa lata UCREL1]|uniref:Uncharacterized protein n=1 Tax=Eutypa lata (strain UCR-EL1) TaxID=1287681 RepID=M7SFZ4_EUTLA|nr:hypothetical protein UCREL1_7852 [Eutypa lata UCREL1]